MDSSINNSLKRSFSNNQKSKKIFNCWNFSKKKFKII